MRRFLAGMFLPTLILVAGLALDSWLPADPQGGLVPTTSASALDDPRLARTARFIEGLNQGHQHASRREPLGRPGMLFSFRMPDHIRKQYWEGRGDDNPGEFQWADVELAIEGRPYFRILSRVRGSSSAEVARKSLSLRLFSSQRFADDIRLRRFLLINLYADPTGFKNRWCFNLLATMGLYPGYHELATVEFNGESQGTYMVLERPEEALRRAFPDTVSVFRRRTDHFQLKYREPGTDAWEAVRSFEACHGVDDFQAQVRCYEGAIDLEQYLQWRAFNSLVQNGDSIDELFYYERREDPHVPGQLEIMAWDFDDIHQEPAHPDEVHRDPLMWAAEGELDRQIIENRVLYARYKQVLGRMLEDHLTEKRLVSEMDSIQRVLDGIVADLPPDQASRVVEQASAEIGAFRPRLLERRSELLRGAVPSHARAGE